MLSPLYLAEISPPEVRGSLMSLEQFAIVLGVVLGFWTGFFTRSRTSLFYTHPCTLNQMKILYCFSSSLFSVSERVLVMANTTCIPNLSSSHSYVG